MHLGIRLLFGFFLVTGLAAFFVLRVFVTEVKPSVREVMEDMMVDTAHVLAELASDDLVAGNMATGRFAQRVTSYATRPINAQIWGLSKQSLDYRVYVTDSQGTVLFDSENIAVGQDYSQWRDVARTLRGEYGARATRELQHDDRSSILYVAAPIEHLGKTIGVLTVAKPVATVQAFIDRAERKILLRGALLLVLSLAIGVVVTLWLVWSIRKLRNYAAAVGRGGKPALPQVPGELGELARAMDAMRRELEGHAYIEGYVRALSHELKSPLAAIRGAGELLQGPLPESARREFSGQVLAQTAQLEAMVNTMLELTKLEQRQAAPQLQTLLWADFFASLKPMAQNPFATHTLEFIIEPKEAGIRAEPGLLKLALSNLIENAKAFAPVGTVINIHAQEGRVTVRDFGPGVADFALPKLGERFFSTARPDGQSKGSGLGLAIVRQIMVLHGGTMQASHAGPGLRVTLNFCHATVP